MKDEIKEILEELESLFEISEAPEHIINGLNKIKDCITNLKEENEYLKKQNDEITKIGIADHKYASQKEDEAIVLQEENKKLNNIINEFEKYLINEIKRLENVEQTPAIVLVTGKIHDIFDEVQQLKEDK